MPCSVRDCIPSWVKLFTVDCSVSYRKWFSLIQWHFHFKKKKRKVRCLSFYWYLTLLCFCLPEQPHFQPSFLNCTENWAAVVTFLSHMFGDLSLFTPKVSLFCGCGRGAHRSSISQEFSWVIRLILPRISDASYSTQFPKPFHVRGTFMNWIPSYNLCLFQLFCAVS